MRGKGSTVCLTLILLSVALPAFAQRITATVRGTVTDPSGAVIQGAEVNLVGTETGYVRTGTTNAAGIFSFGDVPVGLYDLTVSHPGFQLTVYETLQLNVAEVRDLDVEMQPGAVEDQITVAAPVLQVEKIGGELAGLVTGEQIRELPLNGRNFTQLTLLMPGVSSPEGFDTKNKGLLTGTDLSVSGGAVTANLWTVDGANNNDVGSNRTILIYPSVDAIEEFKIHRNSYGAEFGGSSGAQINLITRSGTNAYEGSVFWFHRDDSLNEKNFFLERSGQDKEDLDRDDYGFTFGGPLIQDKLHFFVSSEWNDEVRGIVRTGFVPTAAERQGDFSGPSIPGCTLAAPIDPLTGQPFPGNVIPGDRLSQAGIDFLNLYPLPNVNPAGGSCLNWIESVNTPIDWQQFNGRLDYSLTDSSRLMVRYTRDEWLNDAPNAGEGNGLWGDDPFPAVDSAWDQPSESFVAQLNQTLGTTAINTLQFSYSANEIEISRGGRNPQLNAAINSHIPPVFSGKTGGDDRSHPVFWGGQGYAPLWNIAPWQNQQDLYILKDDYQQVFGEHWLKAGALYSQNSKQETIGGASAFETPQFWGAAGINGWGATSGNVLADFLLDDMTFGFAENSVQPAPDLEWEDYEFYLADSWQVTPQLNLDLGLRYSFFQKPEASSNRITAFNPDLYDPALGGDPCNGLMMVPGTDPCGEAGFLGGAAGPNASLVEDDEDNFAPRLGLAWDVFGTGRSVLRAGFGQFYLRERVNIQLEFAGNPPFIANQNGIRKLDDATEPCGGCFALANGVPRVGIDPESETPYNWQWNLTWEQQILDNSTLELSYVGNRGKHLTRRSDINQVPFGDADGDGIADRLEYVRCGDDAGCRGALRPFSAFGDSGILYWENDGRSEYDALQTQFISRFGRGSQLQFSYTYSEFQANDPLNDSGAGTFRGQITDRDNKGVDWGNAALHRPHVLNASLLWHLPSLENSDSGFVRSVLGDWAVGTIVQYASGAALTVYTGAIPGIAGGVSGTGFLDNQRPNRVPGEPCRASGGPEEQWLNPSAWTLSGFQLGEIGNAGRGECEGPDFFQVDLSLYKNFDLWKGVSGQVRFEVFNLTNRTNFVGVNTIMNPTSVSLDAPLGQATEVVDFELPGNFGQAFGVRDPRQFQIGFKLFF